MDDIPAAARVRMMPPPRPPVIRLGYPALALGVAVAGVFLAGDMMLPEWLGIDLDCLDRRMGRRSEAVELVLCAAGAGPKGWLYLAWFAAPLVLFALWLRRALRRAQAAPPSAEPPPRSG